MKTEKKTDKMLRKAFQERLSHPDIDAGLLTRRTMNMLPPRRRYPWWVSVSLYAAAAVTAVAVWIYTFGNFLASGSLSALLPAFGAVGAVGVTLALLVDDAGAAPTPRRSAAP